MPAFTTFSTVFLPTATASSSALAVSSACLAAACDACRGISIALAGKRAFDVSGDSEDGADTAGSATLAGSGVVSGAVIGIGVSDFTLGSGDAAALEAGLRAGALLVVRLAGVIFAVLMVIGLPGITSKGTRRSIRVPVPGCLKVTLHHALPQCAGGSPELPAEGA